MRILKKVSALVAAFALTASMTVTAFGASAGWTDYLGFDGQKGHTWYEAVDGKIKGVSESGWTADIVQNGWGGIWGGQMSRKVNLVKGKQYHIKATFASKQNKWIFIKISTKENFAYGKWIWVKKGGSATVDETFTAKNNADTMTIGFGGEYGDREATDGKNHYAYVDGANGDGTKGAKIIAGKKDCDGDSAGKNTITCSNYSLEEEGAADTNTGSTDTNTGSTSTSTSTGTTTTTTTSTVATGDFSPYACAAAAVLAAAVIVVFARKRENN